MHRVCHRLPPLHLQLTTFADAQRYCDAEPSCEGFTLTLPPAQPPWGSNDGDAVRWVTFARDPLGAAQTSVAGRPHTQCTAPTPCTLPPPVPPSVCTADPISDVHH